MLRIITGIAKGKKIETLEGEATRPTSERIKEAVFSSIQFDIENRRVLDLFAGSGQLGLEALSRGAASAMFVDASAEAMGHVRRTFEKAGILWQLATLGKVDQGGGGTVAAYMANRNIVTVDAGVPVLSMHAPMELVSKLDCYMTMLACKAIYLA